MGAALPGSSCILDWLRSIICWILGLLGSVLTCLRNGVCNTTV